MTSASPTTFPPPGSKQDLESGTMLSPKFDANGLIAAVATDVVTGEVLMLAWMNADALRQTIETRVAHFWSRSYRRLWKKGEESGNVLSVEEMRMDCDQDAVWLRVRVAGPGVACHTGKRSCFYRRIELGPEAAIAPRLTHLQNG
jgi:phosphoribosyl-AMP cyclohydrolase